MTAKKTRKTARKGSQLSRETYLPAEDMESSMTEAKALSAPIPKEQWDLPAGFRSDGQIATLRDVVNPKVPTVALSEVTPEQRVDLVVKRIEAQPDFKIATVGAGIVDKDRAIAEVRAGSSLGHTLMEIEQRVINNLTERGVKGTGS
jgi:hypothetical protein